MSAAKGRGGGGGREAGGGWEMRGGMGVGVGGREMLQRFSQCMNRLLGFVAAILCHCPSR